MSGTLVGTVVAIAILIDAVSDPAVGMFSDRLQTRFGRRHPLMLASAVPLGLCYAALFAPPAGLGEVQLALWMLVFASMTRISLTFFSVPHLALGAELDDSRLGRTRMMSWHAAFLWVGGASCHFLGLTYFFDGPNAPGSGMLRGDAYPFYGMVWGTVMAALVLATTFATVHRIPYLRKPEPEKLSGPRHLFRDFGEVLTNRNYVWLLAGMVLYAATVGMHEAFSSHLATYYFELSPDQFRFYGIGSLVGYLIGFAITVQLHKRMPKVVLVALMATGCSAASSVAIWLRMLGLFPENGDPLLFPMVLFFVFCFYCMQSILIISITSLLGDIADEHELNRGRRREGVLYSARSFFGKAAGALGHMIGGIMLDLIRFPLGANVRPGTVDPEIIWNMGLNYGVIATIPGLLAAVAYLRCKMNAELHDQILEKLGRKHEAPAGEAS